MKLRNFVAASMAEGMKEVRAALGEEAIIVSSVTQENGSVRIMAALEPAEVPGARIDFKPGAAIDETLETLDQALTYHGVPLDLTSRLIGLAAAIDVDDPVMRLSAVLDDIYRFSTLSRGATANPVMMIGPPGMGKSVTTAKLAARAALSGNPATVISIDTSRAAASDQLAAFTRILGIDLKIAETPSELGAAIRASDPAGPVFVDSDGTNPFDYDEIARLIEFVEVSEVDTALVLAAGLDSLEAAEIAEAYGVLRPTRVITTRVDVARRLGSMLTAADAGGYAFGDAGIAASIADGLAGLTPSSLAHLLMRDPLNPNLELHNAEAAE